MTDEGELELEQDWLGETALVVLAEAEARLLYAYLASRFGPLWKDGLQSRDEP